MTGYKLSVQTKASRSNCQRPIFARMVTQRENRATAHDNPSRVIKDRVTQRLVYTIKQPLVAHF